MRRRHRSWLIVGLAVVAAIGPSIATAQTSAALTIDQIVAMAVQRSKRIAATRAGIDVARGEREQAGLRMNPAIDLNQSEEIGGAGRRTGFGLMWPLELSRVPARSAVGDRQIEAATLDAGRVEWELSAQVRQAAAKTLEAMSALDVIDQQTAAARALRDLVDASVSAGALPRLDRDVAEVDVRRLEAASQLAQGEVAARLAALKGVIGMNQDEPLVLTPIADEVNAIFNRSVPAMLPPPDRPDLAVAHAELRVTQAQTNLARQEGRWDLSFAAGFMRSRMGFPQLGLSPDGRAVPIEGRVHELSLGATITIPWRNRNQGAVRASAARTTAATAVRDAIQIEAAADQAASRARWMAGREAVGRYRDGLLTLARQNLDVIQQTYLAGRGTLNDVIAERRRLLELELAYTGLMGELLTADADLRRAMGATR